MTAVIAAVLALGQSQQPRNIGLGAHANRAVVLFDGKNLGSWLRDGSTDAAAWEVADGVATVKGGTIATKEKFGSGHYHLEFNEPLMADKTSQARGNSGFYLLGRYEVQILDSYENPTYATGGCGSLYGQKDPDTNQAKKPGEWQVYDAFFTAPVVDASGKQTKAPVLTLYWNGVMVHNKVELTEKADQSKDAAPVATGPIKLQDHGCPVKFRNIWFQPTRQR